MANLDALPLLFDSVAAYFAALGTGTAVDFGWHARAKILNQGVGGANRVVIVPGDPKTGAAGKFSRGRQAETNPRVLLQFDEQAVVCLWGVDTSDIRSERLQYAATKQLLELTVQALHRAIDPSSGRAVGFANISIASPTWSVENTELYFGREMQLQLTQRGPLFDTTFDTATPDAAVTRHPIP
jgi:hypothetical protein